MRHSCCFRRALLWKATSHRKATVSFEGDCRNGGGCHEDAI